MDNATWLSADNHYACKGELPEYQFNFIPTELAQFPVTLLNHVLL